MDKTMIAGIFGATTVSGLLVAFWSQIKLYLNKIYSLFVVNIEFDNEMGNIFSRYLQKNFKCSKFGNKTIGANSMFIRDKKKILSVAYEKIPTQITIWWKGYKPLTVTGSSSGNRNNDDSKYSVSFIRGFYNLDNLVKKAVNEYNKFNMENNKNQRFRIVRYSGKSPTRGSLDKISEAPVYIDKYQNRLIGYNYDEIGQPYKKSAMDDLSLSDDLLKVLEEADFWRDNESWFKETGVPWKRGWLFSGAPGTGKTAFVRALGQKLNMPIMLFDLATMSNSEFIYYWKQMTDYLPAIALFEDIDAIFNGRENVVKSGLNNDKLTFDCFLNTIDGVENTNGIFVVITTNDITKIDSAIAQSGSDIPSRPGRIDRIIKFKKLEEKGRVKMANKILSRFNKSVWDDIINNGKDDTGAQFQERCCKLALKLFWKEKEKNK